MIEVHVGQRGEIVIPKRLRERYGIKPNSTIYLAEKDTIELHPKSLKEALQDTYRRWSRFRTVDAKVLAEALKGEPYEDDQP